MDKSTSARHRPRAVFLTGRFRSGSTLLWNIFRNVPGVVAYYEPCHDMLLTHIDCLTPPTESHPGVSSYWDEYIPILARLRDMHRSEFGVTRLLLEENDEYEELARYIEFLIGEAGDRLPVLKFNRVDFRLPWLRRRFPDCRIIHIWRNSRDQWYSTVRAEPRERWGDPYLATTYELMTWSCALAPEFPFLFSPIAKSSYHRHYLLWRLSKLMGQRASDLAVAFGNDLVAEPEASIARLLSSAGVEADATSLASLVAKPRTGGWREFADDGWFRAAEDECDALLDSLGLVDCFAAKPLADIRRDNPGAWERFGYACAREAMDRALSLFAEARADSFRHRLATFRQHVMIQDLKSRMDTSCMERSGQ